MEYNYKEVSLLHPNNNNYLNEIQISNQKFHYQDKLINQ